MRRFDNSPLESPSLLYLFLQKPRRCVKCLGATFLPCSGCQGTGRQRPLVLLKNSRAQQVPRPPQCKARPLLTFSGLELCVPLVLPLMLLCCCVYPCMFFKKVCKGRGRCICSSCKGEGLSNTRLWKPVDDGGWGPIGYWEQ